MLILHGVPSATTSNGSWRIAGILIFAVGGFYFIEYLVFTMNSRALEMTGVLAAVIVLAVVLFTVFGTSHSGQTSKILFASGAVGIAPLNPKKARNTRSTVAFNGTEKATFKRVSSVWVNIEIRRAKTMVARLGIRCPESSADMVHNAIERVIAQGKPIRADEPQTPKVG